MGWFSRSQSPDIQPSPFPQLDWSDGQRGPSLSKLQDYFVAEATAASGWYDRKRPWKRFFAQSLRGSAILFTGAGGLIPLIGKAWEIGGKPSIDPILSAVCVGIAGILIVWDRFYGFSAAWVRYMKARQQINQFLKTFLFDFAIARLKWDKPDPTTSQAEAGLAACKAAVIELDALVQRETDQWIADFQNALTQMEAAGKEVAPAKPLGAIAIKVTNGDQCAAPGWQLIVDGGTEQTCIGKEYSVRGVTAGIHNVAVSGTISGVAKQSTKPVEVKDAQIVQMEFTL